MSACSLSLTYDDWVTQLQKKNYERLQKALDSVMSIREMTQVQEWRRKAEEGRVVFKGVAFLSFRLLARGRSVIFKRKTSTYFLKKNSLKTPMLVRFSRARI